VSNMLMSMPIMLQTLSASKGGRTYDASS